MIDDLDNFLERVNSALQTDFDTDIRELVSDLHPADIAVVLESLPPDERIRVWDQIPLDLLGEVLTEVNEGVRAYLVEQGDTDTIAHAISTLDIDDVADLIPTLPDDVISSALFTSGDHSKAEIEAILAYAEDTAGGLMDFDTITIRANIPISVVLRYLRLRGELPDYTDKLFIVNREGQFTGSIIISDLLTNDPDTRVKSLADLDPVKFNVSDSDEDVAAAFERYNLISAPVVNDENELVGRVTIDDVVDVIREQTEHAILAQAGLKEEEDIFAPVIKTTRSRALWLGVNLITALVASWVIGQFESTIEKLVALAVLMPIVASMGGNAGTQTMTLVIRGLATDTIGSHNAWRILRKEFSVGVLNGFLWALVTGTIAYIWFGDYQLGVIVGTAMVINLIAAAVAGAFIPVFFEKVGIDPALASGVALTTVTDVVGFFAILGLAALFLF